MGGVVWDYKGVQVLVLRILVLGFVWVLLVVGSVPRIQRLKLVFFRLGSVVLADVGVSISPKP